MDNFSHITSLSCFKSLTSFVSLDPDLKASGPPGQPPYLKVNWFATLETSADPFTAGPGLAFDWLFRRRCVYIKGWEFCLPHLLEDKDWTLHVFFNSLSFLPQGPCDVFPLLSEVLFKWVYLSGCRFMSNAPWGTGVSNGHLCSVSACDIPLVQVQSEARNLHFSLVPLESGWSTDHWREIIPDTVCALRGRAILSRASRRHWWPKV